MGKQPQAAALALIVTVSHRKHHRPTTKIPIQPIKVVLWDLGTELQAMIAEIL
jgi:hypothetical protein